MIQTKYFDAEVSFPGDGEMLSRGEVIDKAVAMLAESAKKEASK